MPLSPENDASLGLFLASLDMVTQGYEPRYTYAVGIFMAIQHPEYACAMYQLLLDDMGRFGERLSETVTMLVERFPIEAVLEPEEADSVGMR